MNKKITLFLSVCLLICVLTSCGAKEQNVLQQDSVKVSSTAPEQSKSIEMTQQSETVKEAQEPEPISANDGFIVPAEGVRPIAVMIDNEGTRVLPQGGIDKAQIVYEVIVEGGLTRLMPVFWGTNPEMIGLVRSSRDYFLDYCMEYDAIYVHFGWSPQAQADIPKLKINNINGLYVGNDVIWDLTKDRSNWQDSYTSMEKLLAYAKKLKYKTTTDTKYPFQYNQTDIVSENGEAAVKISMKYSAGYTSGYEYDKDSGMYMRFRKGKPQMERVSGKQLMAKNVIIQFTPNYDIKGDNKGRQEMDTTGSGKGYFITEGKAIKIKWSKASRRAQTMYTDEAGNKIKLNKGQTWIQVMPLTAKVSISAE